VSPASNLSDRDEEKLKASNIADSRDSNPKTGSSSRKANDYDERAVKLWSVYTKEAESHDKALIETWKDDMEGVIIFVRELLIIAFQL
jgi:Family of unknown function (DUF6535)